MKVLEGRTQDDIIKMLQDIRETIGEDEAIIHPIGWGAARDFDRLEKLMYTNDISFPYVRYDLSQSEDIWYGFRKITINPHKIRRHLENGTARLITLKGIKFVPLSRTVSFDRPRPYIVFDDWVQSGSSLAGGEFYIAYHADVFNPKAIYGCTLNDCAGIAYFSAFKGYEKENKPYLGINRFLENLESKIRRLSKYYSRTGKQSAYDALQKRGTLRLIKE